MTLVRSNAFEAVDGFDTAYNPYGFEDLDFCLRVKEAGYRCVYIPEAVIYHSPTQTFEGGKYSEQYARQKAKNWYRFVRRHANPIEEVAFWLLGVPIRLVGAFGREARQGNISALAGLITGGLNQIFRSSEQK
jgi:GT2 family glycosyltransferase